MKKRTKNILLGFLGILIILTGGAFAYLSNSYGPTSEAVSAMNSTESVEVVNQKDHQTFIPKEATEKGGKVEAIVNFIEKNQEIK